MKCDEFYGFSMVPALSKISRTMLFPDHYCRGVRPFGGTVLPASAPRAPRLTASGVSLSVPMMRKVSSPPHLQNNAAPVASAAGVAWQLELAGSRKEANLHKTTQPGLRLFSAGEADRQ
jgi:hypothetical protein